MTTTMIEAVKSVIRKPPFVGPAIRMKGKLARPKAQNEEAVILRRLLAQYEIPKLFVEFGFSGWEFNCAPLIDEWEGLLLDGDAYNVRIANIILSERITAKRMWIDLDTIAEVDAYVAGRPLGILSVDVDGNDFWFLRRLIGLRPAIIIAEYNSTLGLRPITVPYDRAFDRLTAHDSHTYYGASLTALNALASANGYALVDGTPGGINAFFLRVDLLHPDDVVIPPAYVFREKQFGDGGRAHQFWDRIAAMPFVDVVAQPAALDPAVASL